jgi:hypothetical protein
MRLEQGLLGGPETPRQRLGWDEGTSRAHRSEPDPGAPQ